MSEVLLSSVENYNNNSDINTQDLESRYNELKTQKESLEISIYDLDENLKLKIDELNSLYQEADDLSEQISILEEIISLLQNMY